MLPSSPSEEAVVLAVRRHLQSSSSGDGSADTMAQLVAATSQLPLKNLDDWERLLREESQSADKHRHAAGWRFWKSPDRTAAWLDLCDANGYVREKALRALPAEAPNGFFFSLALRRLNDWVPEVREAARAYVARAATCSRPGHIVDGLWSTLPNFPSWGRMTAEDHAALLALLSVPQVALALKARIIQATSGPAAAVLAQAGRTPALDSSLREIAGSAVQPSARAKAYRSLLERRVAWAVGRKWVWTDLKWCKGRFEPVLGERELELYPLFVEVLKSALADSSPMVRRVAGEFLIKHMDAVGADAQALARTLAADPSPRVAERGRFALSRLGIVS